MRLCNVHFHQFAEHKGKGYAGAAGTGDNKGFACDGGPAKPKAAGHGTACKPKNGHGAALSVGDTIEVHWVFTSCDVKPGPRSGWLRQLSECAAAGRGQGFLPDRRCHGSHLRRRGRQHRSACRQRHGRISGLYDRQRQIRQAQQLLAAAGDLECHSGLQSPEALQRRRLVRQGQRLQGGSCPRRQAVGERPEAAVRDEVTCTLSTAPRRPFVPCRRGDACGRSTERGGRHQDLRNVGSAGMSLMLPSTISANGSSCAAVPVPDSTPTVSAKLAARPMARSCTASPTTAISPGSIPPPRRTPAPCRGRLGAMAGVVAAGEIDRSSMPVRLSDASVPRRIVGGDADAQPAPLSVASVSVHAGDQHGMLGPPSVKQPVEARSQAGAECAPPDAQRTHRRSRQCCRRPAASRRPSRRSRGPAHARAAAPPPAPHRPRRRTAPPPGSSAPRCAHSRGWCRPCRTGCRGSSLLRPPHRAAFRPRRRRLLAGSCATTDRGWWARCRTADWPDPRRS